MPFTPFHFGPGAALHALSPKCISFLAFCAANVLIDIEVLYFMLTRQYPLHRFLHTYIGASLIVAGTLALFAASRWLAARVSLPNPFEWQQLTPWPVVLGAATGAYSHIVLDSIMHADIAPFAPFSDVNPMLDAVPLGALQGFCLAAGMVGLSVIGIRRLLRKENV